MQNRILIGATILATLAFGWVPDYTERERTGGRGSRQHGFRRADSRRPKTPSYANGSLHAGSHRAGRGPQALCAVQLLGGAMAATPETAWAQVCAVKRGCMAIRMRTYMSLLRKADATECRLGERKSPKDQIWKLAAYVKSMRSPLESDPPEQK